MNWGRLVAMLRLVAEKWQRDDCGTIGASLAYFALFSLFPLILVILSVVGFVIDPNEFEVRQQLLSLIGSAEVRETVTQTLENLSENRVNTGLLGFVTLILAASGIFGALDRAFDIIWEVASLNKPKPSGIVASAVAFLKDKFFSFSLVLGCAALLLLSILSTVVITAMSNYTTWLPGQGILLQIAQFVAAALLLTLALSAIYKYLPDRPVAWGDVWIAGLIAAIIFTILQKVAGIYLSTTNYATYGAVGGVMTLLVYIYLTCLVLLLGGELSYAYARSYGSLARVRAEGQGNEGAEEQGDRGTVSPL